MKTTQGDSTYTYCTEGKTPKSVRVMSEAICAPDLDAPKEEKQMFIKILEEYEKRLES